MNEIQEKIDKYMNNEEHIYYISSKIGAITNPLRSDGLGEQVKGIIFTILFAKIFNFEFYYTPIKSMEHNIDNTSKFIKDIEESLGFINNYPINTFKNLQREQRIDDSGRITDFFLLNIHLFKNNEYFEEIKKIFKNKKKYSDYFSRDKNIAIHIRRSNFCDTHQRLDDGTYLDILRDNQLLKFQMSLYDDEFYIKLINKVLKKYPDYMIHIYTQDINLFNYKSFLDNKSIKFHINEDLLNSFYSMIFADILIIGPSNFSYVAAILSDNLVYYLHYCLKPLPDWIILNKENIDIILNEYSSSIS